MSFKFFCKQVVFYGFHSIKNHNNGFYQGQRLLVQSSLAICSLLYFVNARYYFCNCHLGSCLITKKSSRSRGRHIRMEKKTEKNQKHLLFREEHLSDQAFTVRRYKLTLVFRVVSLLALKPLVIYEILLLLTE